MKSEHEFNAFLKKEFRKYSEYKAIKISDRFKIGLPDWLIFHDGRAVAVECKWAKEYKIESNILGHSLSAPQVTVLKSFEGVQVPAVVLVGLSDTKTMAVGSWAAFTKGGNITGRIMINARFEFFPMTDTYDLLKHLFGVS